MYEDRYKTCSPKKTIDRVTSLLQGENICFKNPEWWNQENSFLPKSVFLKLVELPFFVNGKGIDEQFALASAYGELMERLQNISVLRSKFRLNVNDNHYLITPDRKRLTNTLFKKNEKAIIHSLIEGKILPNLDDKKYSLGAVQYVHANSGQIEYLPDELISLCVGSNGMCAGNSITEALIQGVCEIFERHVLKKLYFDKDITIFKIPTKIIKNFDINLQKSVKYLESMGYKISIGDCSLNGVYPVVGLFVWKKNFFRFQLGSAPDFQIALERCFTEMFQGKHFKDFERWLIDLDEEEEKERTDAYWKKQLFKSLDSYSGKIKGVILTERPAGKNSVFTFRGKNNKETFKNLLNILISQNIDVYIRDVSYLSFPAFHIYVPEISNVTKLSVKNITIYHEISKASSILCNLGEARIEQIKFLIDIIEFLVKEQSTFCNNNETVLFSLLKIPEGILEDYFSVNDILCFLYFYTLDYAKSLKIINKRIEKECLKDKKNSKFLTLNCLKNFIELSLKGDNLIRIKTRLEHKFPRKIISELFQVLNSPEVLSEYLINIEDKHRSRKIVDFCLKIQKLINKYSFNQKTLRKYILGLYN